MFSGGQVRVSFTDRHIRVSVQFKQRDRACVDIHLRKTNQKAKDLYIHKSAQLLALQSLLQMPTTHSRYRVL